jgi:phosphatidylserine/phosphatidylglycerophosphate/cardiolipin synthase-like enzyme
MNHQEIDKILKHTLEDFRLSRGERRILNSILKEIDAGKQERGFLRNRAFALASEQMQENNAREILEWLEEVVKVLSQEQTDKAIADEAYFSPGDVCPRKIIHLIDGVRKKVDICVFTITDDTITDAILEAHRREVSIRIITDNDKAEDRGSDIDRLERSGIPVRVDKTDFHMHHKFAVFDGRQVLTGSYNWTRSAARYNEENFIVTHDTRLTRLFSQQFEELWQKLK